MRGIARPLTAATLAGIAGIHIAWGRGSSFPFASHDELADAVVGRAAVPSAGACYAVATALTVAGGLVADVPIGPAWLRRVGRYGVAAVLGARGTVGLLGRTDLLSPGSASPRFRRLDRQLFAPLCLALATGALA